MAGIADFPLFVMNFDHLLNDDIYFLLVFSLLDFTIYSHIFSARAALSADDVSMPAKNKLSCTLCSMFSSGIKNEKTEQVAFNI